MGGLPGKADFKFDEYSSTGRRDIEDGSVVLGQQPWRFQATITPERPHYGMIAAIDRTCDGNQQFRIEIYKSMKVRRSPVLSCHLSLSQNHHLLLLPGVRCDGRHWHAERAERRRQQRVSRRPVL